MKIIEVIFFITCILGTLILMATSHLDLDKRLKVIEQIRLEQIEKERLIVGYWTWNSQYCQYFYEAKK